MLKAMGEYIEKGNASGYSTNKNYLKTTLANDVILLFTSLAKSHKVENRIKGYLC